MTGLARFAAGDPIVHQLADSSGPRPYPVPEAPVIERCDITRRHDDLNPLFLLLHGLNLHNMIDNGKGLGNKCVNYTT